MTLLVSAVTHEEQTSEDAIVAERKKFLVELRQSNYSLPIEKLEKYRAALYFVSKYILFTDGKFVTPQHRPYQHAIEDYLQTFVKDGTTLANIQ